MRNDLDYVIELTGSGQHLVQSLRQDDADDSLRGQVGGLLAQFEEAISMAPVDQARYDLQMQVGTLPLAELANRLEEFLLGASSASQRMADADTAAASRFGNLW